LSLRFDDLDSVGEHTEDDFGQLVVTSKATPGFLGGLGELGASAVLIQRRRAPPRGLATQRPVSRKHFTQITAVLALTSWCSAASRREAPLYTRPITRCRISAELAFARLNLVLLDSIPCKKVETDTCRRSS
jgi:hypothetical protein